MIKNTERCIKSKLMIYFSSFEHFINTINLLLTVLKKIKQYNKQSKIEILNTIVRFNFNYL